MVSMKIVVGLGNPGERYENTRHNVGFEVVEQLQSKILNSNIEIRNNVQNPKFQLNKRFEAEVCQVGEVLLVKPQTFMNESGNAVSKVVNFYKVSLDDVWVVHDDLDIVMGEYKIHLGKGPKIHNGIGSVEAKLGSKDFWRVRVGVDSRGESNRKDMDDVKFQSDRIPGREYVLMKLDGDDKENLESVVNELVEEMIARLLGSEGLG